MRVRPLYTCRPSAEWKPSLPEADALLFDNGYGGFTRDSGDYRITLPAGRQTPAPWCNPLCSDCFGTLAGESGLTAGERHAVAQHVAELNAEAALAAHHRPKAGTSARLPVLLGYATLITERPDQASPEAIQALMSAGLAPRDVVMLGQLIAHVNFEARLLAGLRLLEAV